MTVRLLEYILEASRGLDNHALGGYDLFRNGTAEGIAALLGLNVLKEIAPSEELFCQKQCMCEDNLLQVEILDDERARLSCPSGQIPSEVIPISEVRRFRFSRNDFLAWVCRENGYRRVPNFNPEIASGVYHFADATLLERNLSLCMVTGSVSVNFFERLFILSEIFAYQLAVALTTSPIALSQTEIKTLADKEVFVNSLSDVIKLPLPTIDLSFVERRIVHGERSHRPELILQTIPTGTNRGTAVQLVGRKLKGKSILLGRSQLLIIYALMNAQPSRHEDKPALVLEEKTLVKKYLDWRKRKWITLNLGRNEKPGHRLTKTWHTFVKQMERSGITDVFIRKNENGRIKYILALDSKEVDCRIPDLADAVQKTADSGRRPKDDPMI